MWCECSAFNLDLGVEPLAMTRILHFCFLDRKMESQAVNGNYKVRVKIVVKGKVKIISTEPCLF